MYQVKKSRSIAMELRLLKYFWTIAEEGTISQAAEVLHLTQPTLSRQLKELEEELGTELVVRENRKMILTEAGYFLKKPSRRNFRFNESNHSRIREQKKTIIQRPIYDRLCGS
ncbi:TPA: LysR family transcriptional regulator [Enterococcus faecium]|nr:LysR family transcriptional regulator [Enterococcus faecium]